MRRGYATSHGDGHERPFGLTFGDFCDCIVIFAASANPDPFAPVCPKVEKVISRLFAGIAKHWEDKRESGAQVGTAVQELLAALQASGDSKNKRKSVTFGG